MQRHSGRPHSGLFDAITIIGGLTVLIHGWGAIRKEQSWTETAESGFWLVFTGLTIFVGLGLP
ncbi:MAG: hypothetical protein AAGF12_18175 [Myxococcota bacterium]